MISRQDSLGGVVAPVVTNDGVPYMGIGQFTRYQRHANPFSNLTAKEHARIQRAAPPALPQGVFPDQASAEAWVRAVIAWCTLQYDDCGGPAVVLTIP